MPTYTYICESCGYQYDKLQSISAQPDKNCPKCEGEVKRMIGAGIGIVFKGSGFYVTDYKNNSPNSSSKKKETATTTDSSK